MYAAQAIPPIDADMSRSRRGIAGKGHLWMETTYFMKRQCSSRNRRDIFVGHTSVHNVILLFRKMATSKVDLCFSRLGESVAPGEIGKHL